MKVQCTASKRDGTPCTLPATGPHGLCWAHDPANADARRRGASRGGKGKGNRGELTAIKRRLAELAEGVIRGEVDRGDAAVFAQLHNVILRAIATELRIREVEDIRERLEALEDLQRQRDRSGYGA